MSLDIGDVVLLSVPITVTRVIGQEVECAWMVGNLKQTGIFNALDLSKSPCQLDSSDI